MTLPINSVISCCHDLVQKLLHSDIGIPLSECSDFDWKSLVDNDLAHIDTHRGIQVLKGTNKLFDNCNCS